MSITIDESGRPAGGILTTRVLKMTSVLFGPSAWCNVVFQPRLWWKTFSFTITIISGGPVMLRALKLANHDELSSDVLVEQGSRVVSNGRSGFFVVSPDKDVVLTFENVGSAEAQVVVRMEGQALLADESQFNEAEKLIAAYKKVKGEVVSGRRQADDLTPVQKAGNLLTVARTTADALASVIEISEFLGPQAYESSGFHEAELLIRRALAEEEGVSLGAEHVERLTSYESNRRS